jgi:hypothetical protein
MVAIMGTPLSLVMLVAALSAGAPPVGESTPLGRYAQATGAAAALDADTACAAMRNLVARGIMPMRAATPAAPDDAAADERMVALEALSALRSPIELAAALKVLAGEGSRPDFIACDMDVRRALFAALAKEPTVGEPALVRFALAGSGNVRQRALDALPEKLSPKAQAELAGFLASQREFEINQAASIASAHSAAALIPSLIDAQYEPPRAKRGDEAWIAQGTSIHYVQNAIPVVGGSSTSFQPVIGTIFEGSLLRIMESMVEIYRTEVHESLAMIVEHETGKPAPPFGYDQARWMAWYRTEYPKLAAAHRADVEQAETAATTRTTRSTKDS